MTASSQLCRCCGAIRVVAKGVLRRLAAFQATTFDPLADAEPGKILHEMRGGEMAALRRGPVWPLLRQRGCDTPVCHAGRTLCRAHRRRRNAERALAQHRSSARLDRRAGRSRPRRLCRISCAPTNGALSIRAGRTSQDAIFHADGSLAQGPIALCEVQGYVYAAKSLAARGAHRLGKHASGEALEAQADEPRQTI